MSTRTQPPFRADHVGSFLRPQSLLDMRQKHASGEVTAEALKAHEDECIAELVRFEEGLGLQSITSGEFRRETFHGDFVSQIENVEFKQLFPPGQTEAGGHEAPFVAVVSGRMGLPKGGIDVDDFRYLKSLTTRTAKQTIPSPTMMHFRGGRRAIDATAYPDMDEFFTDLARVYREEVDAMAGAGCRYLQLDDTNLAYLCDETMRARVTERGEDIERLPHDYAKLINDSIRTRPDGMAVCVHLCRGNARSRWFASGGYEPVAEVIFNEMNVDGFFFLYDDARSGGFGPLKFVPKDKTIVLGLVSSKWAELEKKSDVIARIEEAAKMVPLDQLCLSPQCGFASIAAGNQIGQDIQKAKLGLVIEVAAEVWGK